MTISVRIACFVGLSAATATAFAQSEQVVAAPSTATATTSPLPAAASNPTAPASVAFPAPSNPQPANPPSPLVQNVAAPPPAPSSNPTAVQREPPNANAAPNDQSASPQWSVGAGIGYSVLGSGYGAFPSEGVESIPQNASMLTGLGGMYNVATPSPLAFLERRLTNGVFALLQAEGTYTKTMDSSAEREREQVGCSVGPGIRWVLNSGAPVEVGMTHVVYYAWERTTTRTRESDMNDTANTSTSRVTSRAFGASTSLIAERELMSRLWLRVGATFLRAYTSRTGMTFEDASGSAPEREAKSDGIHLGFEPSLTLRLAF